MLYITYVGSRGCVVMFCMFPEISRSSDRQPRRSLVFYVFEIFRFFLDFSCNFYGKYADVRFQKNIN